MPEREAGGTRGHDLIVVGHRGHPLGDYLLGGTADRVATMRIAL